MRLAPENDLPVVCGVCLQSPAAHNPKCRYVNFESAYDGPVVKDPMRAQAEPGVYIEKIVICEFCLKEGARLLGLEDSSELKAHIANMEAHADQQDAEIAAKDRTISDLNHTVSTLIESPVKRPPGRPQLRGPEDAEPVLKEMRSQKKKTKKA